MGNSLRVSELDFEPSGRVLREEGACPADRESGQSEDAECGEREPYEQLELHRGPFSRRCI